MEHTEILAKHPAKHVIDSLQPFVTEARQQRIADVLSSRLHSIELVMESPADMHNAFAAIRSAEAFGIYRVHIITPEGEAGAIRQISQGTHYWIDLQLHESLEDYLAQRDDQLLAGGALHLEQPTSVQELPVEQPLSIILGNENRGLSEEAKAACDVLFQIPMCGMAESLNLSVSAAISLFNCSNRRRECLGESGDLSDAQYEQLQAKYFLNSVSERLIEGLLG